MFGKIIAGTTLAGALAFGTVGIAGATTPSTPPAANTGLACSFLQQIQPELQAFAHDYSDAATQVKNIETAAKAAGYTKAAKAIERRAKAVEARANVISKRFKKAEARCGSTGGATSNSGSGNTGSTGSGSGNTGSTGSGSTSTSSTTS
jgi:hypothetical protein